MLRKKAVETRRVWRRFVINGALTDPDINPWAIGAMCDPEINEVIWAPPTIVTGDGVHFVETFQFWITWFCFKEIIGLAR